MSIAARQLEVTYRHGKVLAAYYYLPRRPGDVSAKCVAGSDGLITDLAADGRPLGIEITAPSRFTLPAFNAALAAVQLQPASADEMSPLLPRCESAASPSTGRGG